MDKECAFCKSVLENDVCQRKDCRMYGIYLPDPKIRQQGSDAKDSIYSNLDESTKQIILAQNRTTHAIRAVVRFLFIQLTAITLALIIGAFGNAIDNGFMIFIAAVIYIVGIIWSSNAGWSELGKSNIPK